MTGISKKRAQQSTHISWSLVLVAHCKGVNTGIFCKWEQRLNHSHAMICQRYLGLRGLLESGSQTVSIDTPIFAKHCIHSPKVRYSQWLEQNTKEQTAKRRKKISKLSSFAVRGPWLKLMTKDYGRGRHRAARKLSIDGSARHTAHK